MRKIVLPVVLLLVRVAVAQPIVETFPDGYREPDPTPVIPAYIFVEPIQVILLGPDALDEPRGSSFSHFFHADRFGLAVSGAAVAVDVATGVLSKQEFDDRESGSLVERLSKFDFRGYTLRAIGQVDDGADWATVAVDERKFVNERDEEWNMAPLRHEATENGFRGAFVFMQFTYFISPDLRQIRMVVELHTRAPLTYRRGAPPKTWRRYEYLGPLQEVALRPWRAGEKELLIEEIEKTYEAKLEKNPHNVDVYEKDREQALATIIDRDTIRPATAMQEAWPDNKLEQELEAAIQSMVRMIRTDLAYFLKRLKAGGRSVRFEGLAPDGQRRSFKGKEVSVDGLNTIYQTRDGDLYSVPTVAMP